MLRHLLFLALSLVALWSAPVFASSPSPYRYHGIFIAHDNFPYREPDGVREYYLPDAMRDILPTGSFDPATGSPLRWTSRDALRFYDFLAGYAEPRDLVALLPDPSADQGAHFVLPNDKETVERAFEQAACRIAGLNGSALPAWCHGEGPAVDAEPWKKDVVFVHFAGHGSRRGLLLANGELSKQAFADLVELLGADLVVVVLDSCFGSGKEDGATGATLQAGDVPLLLHGRKGVAVFAAANVVPEREVLRAGVLTHVVLSGLEGAADMDGDRRISFVELSDFFEANTRDAGEMEGETESPGGRVDRILLDARYPMSGAHKVDLTIGRELAARVLVAQDGEVLGEVNTASQTFPRRDVRMTVPLTREGRTSLYLLSVDPRSGRALGGVRVLEDWEPRVAGSYVGTLPTTMAAGTDPLARYMLGMQSGEGLFLRRRPPWHALRLGRMVSATGLIGYHGSQVYGRFEEEDAPSEDSQREMWDTLAEREANGWSFLALGLRGRLHPFSPPVIRRLDTFFVEARGALDVAPSTQVELEQASLAIGRALGGVGLASHLGSRNRLGYLGLGVGTMLVSSKPRDPAKEGTHDPSPRTSYASAGIQLRFLDAWLGLDLVGYRDVITIDDGDGTQKRAYLSWSACLGVDLVHRSL